MQLLDYELEFLLIADRIESTELSSALKLLFPFINSRIGVFISTVQFSELHCRNVNILHICDLQYYEYTLEK